MGFFDFLKRKKPAQQSRPMVVRAYAGADGGRLFGSWNATDSSGDEAIQYRLRTLRNRSRQLAERAILDMTHELERLPYHIEEMTDKLAAWAPKPLPGTRSAK